MNYSPPLVRLDYDGTDMVPEMAKPVLFGVDKMDGMRSNFEWVASQQAMLSEFARDFMRRVFEMRPAR